MLSLRHFVFTLVAMVSASLGVLAAPAPAAKPNIVVILVDDMGFSDIGCYGSEIPTPNLDKLAAGGLRFTQFYNTGRCCPTRATLLTGLYAHQTGVGAMLNDNGEAFPGFRGRLNDSCVTLAQVLRPAGYFTIMTGKWHVGQADGVVPWKRGFDRSLTAATGGFYQAGRRTKIDLNGEELSGQDPRLGSNWFTTDLWTDYGIKFIDEARAAQKPFFLYLAYNAPHYPLQASAADIAKFRGRYKAGWDKLRVERYERQKQMGLIDPQWALSPRVSEIAAWDSLTAEQQDRFDHMMAVYAACVHHMDRAVGRLVESLRERGVLDNTLILFMSDNGGNAESGPDGRSDGDPTQATSMWYCGESWAHLENTPFRRYKHYNHEGGIATPLIVHWPARIAAHGEYRNQPAHLIDIMPTLVEVGGASYPTTFDHHAILPMEGRSIVPAFSNQPIERDALYWEHTGNAAVRIGDWKLVRQGHTGPWELYNLKVDRTELHDRFTAEPARAKELMAKWEAWALRAHVKPNPRDAPDFGAKAKKKAKSANED